jgi:GT2 family glycosyltransferase
MTHAGAPARPGLARPVTIVMVTWNGLAHTRRCLDWLMPTIRALPVEVVAVDNGSTDGTPDFLRHIPGIRCLLHASNCGFAAGANAGIGAADPDSDIVLLNNDVVLADPDWLPKLAAVAYGRPGAGVVSARLHYPDGRLQDAGSSILYHPIILRRFGMSEPDAGQYGSTRPVPAVSFACVYIRREVIERIGVLDAERYFCYYEDIDYCLRVREAGFSVWCAGEVRVAHVEHGSSGTAAYDLSLRSDREFASRWDDGRRVDPQRTLVLRWPDAADWEHRELLRTLALGLEARGWHIVPRRIQCDGTEIPFEEPSADCRLDDVWRIAALREAERAIATIDLAEGTRELRVAACGRQEVWRLDTGADPDDAPGLHVALVPDRNYFRPHVRAGAEHFRWLAVLAGARGEEAWSLLCAATCTLPHMRAVRMEKLPLPYDLRWSPQAIVVQGAQQRAEIRRHIWTEAAERARLYAETDACVLIGSSAEAGLVALELAAMGIPIAARDVDLPFELRHGESAVRLPDDAGFAAALRTCIETWTRDPGAARRIGHRAALAVAGRSWTRGLDAMSERLDSIVA